MDDTPLYNSRILSAYIAYLAQHYPQIASHDILSRAGLSEREVSDPALWVTQAQVNRFHEAVVQATGDPHLARAAGRHLGEAGPMRLLRSYSMGFLNPGDVYGLMNRYYPYLSRAADNTTRRVGPDKVEVTTRPKPGVAEKPFQCSNRRGAFESVGRFFTEDYSTVEHPECWHRGDPHCRYVISWRPVITRRWKTAALLLLSASLLSTLLLLAQPLWVWLTAAALLAGGSALAALRHYSLTRAQLRNIVTKQQADAKLALEQVQAYHETARLVHEIGQAAATARGVDDLLQGAVSVMKERLGFSHGLVVLADQDPGMLRCRAQFGYPADVFGPTVEVKFARGEPKSLIASVFADQAPTMLDVTEGAGERMSPTEQFLLAGFKVRTIVAVPMTYAEERLGVFVTARDSFQAVTESDIALLSGVALQVSASIMNVQASQRLRDSEHEHRELVQNADSIILRLDADGRIAFVNNYGLSLLGLRADSVVGCTVDGLPLDGGQTGLQPQRIATALAGAGGRRMVYEGQAYLAGGRRWIVWTHSPLIDDANMVIGLLCIGNDITELKQADTHRRQLAAELERAKKMELLGMLAGGVAHDLNNLLAGIVTLPALIAAEIQDDPQLENDLRLIQQAGERAAAIVQDMVTLARRSVTVSDVVDMNELARNCLASAEHQELLRLHPEVRVEFNLEGTLPPVVGSSIHLSKTLTNLVVNAAEAMPRGGTVALTTRSVRLDRPLDAHERIPAGHYVTLSVTDTGVGIRPEELERIFEPFFTNKVMGKSGTGLGMAIVWTAVKDHHGFVDLQTELDQGTTFTIYLPASEATKHESLPEVPSPAAGQGQRILVVDDMPEQCEIATRVLSSLGYVADHATSAEEAVTLASNRRYDLLMLDIMLGTDSDGLDLLKRLREERPGQRAIFVSGFAPEARIEEAKALVEGAFVRKPYRVQDLAIAIDSQINAAGALNPDHTIN